MNRIDRLVAILIHLQGRRVTRAEEIAEEFAISVRTVYRDIAALAEAGVPIVGEAGLGYSIVRGYHLPPVHLTAEEATALITAALLMDRFADSSLSRSMGSALAKIRAVLPQDHQDRIARLESRMSIAPGPHRSRAASLFAIQKALADRTVLHIAYRNSGAPAATQRDVEPLGLTYYGDRWHLIAWCRLRRDYRDFRSDRIESLALLSEQFGPHDDFSLAAFLARREEEVERVTGVIKTDPVAAERVRKEAPFRLLSEERDESGVSFRIEGDKWNWYAGWLLSFGERLSVQEPDDLRKLLQDTARAAAEHHGRTGGG